MIFNVSLVYIRLFSRDLNGTSHGLMMRRVTNDDNHGFLSDNPPPVKSIKINMYLF